MEFIGEEGTLNALISILVIVCASYEKKLQKLKGSSTQGEYEAAAALPNIALNEFLENENFYREKLLHLTNRGNLYRFDKCLETINIILQKEVSKDFFNINDMNLLLDICLREIQREKKPSTRV